MKISKLFHWLYAFLMFLPVFAVMICCGYVVFNKNAKDSYFGETINESKYVNVDTLKLNDTYYLNNSAFVNTGGLYQNDSFTINTNGFTYNGIEYTGMRFYVNSGTYNVVVQFSGTGVTTINVSLGGNNVNIEFTFLGSSTENDFYKDYIKPNLYVYEFNKYSYLSEVFYYSLDEVFTSPVFSWAKTSFLALPITYITALFGMASNNVVNYYLSYWLAISIVYLVFDLIMYVPLLVHRWIDKGIIE